MVYVGCLFVCCSFIFVSLITCEQVLMVYSVSKACAK